jgi:hypothetical protein
MRKGRVFRQPCCGKPEDDRGKTRRNFELVVLRSRIVNDIARMPVFVTVAVPEAEIEIIERPARAAGYAEAPNRTDTSFETPGSCIVTP